MSNRNIVHYVEQGDSTYVLDIERSASGKPDLFLTIRRAGPSEPEVTIIVKDADKVLQPAVAWLAERRLAATALAFEDGTL